MKRWKLPLLSDTPLGVVIALGLLIAVVEIAVHGVLMFFDVADVYPEFVDAALLSILLSPALYYLVFRKLHESEARFRTLTEISSDFYWESDAEHRLRQRGVASKWSAGPLFGRPTQIGERRWEIPCLSPDEAGWQAHRAVLDAHRPFRDFEFSRLGTDGAERHLSIGGDPMFDASGAFKGYRGVGTDITERKQMEKESLEAGARIRDALEVAIGAIAATLEQRDPYTAGHQRRVAQLAVAIGEEMGLAPEALEGIHFGGLIHDIGKISVPAEILGKPGRITGIELGLIKIHAEAGYEIVKGITFPWPVANMVRQHHERLDGSGYPQGLKDGEIILEARILAVADVVEAMLANRPYRAGLGMDAALGEIGRTRGTQLDPVAVDACLRVIKEKGFVFTHG